MADINIQNIDSIDKLRGYFVNNHGALAAKYEGDRISKSKVETSPQDNEEDHHPPGRQLVLEDSKACYPHQEQGPAKGYWSSKALFIS